MSPVKYWLSMAVGPVGDSMLASSPSIISFYQSVALFSGEIPVEKLESGSIGQPQLMRIVGLTSYSRRDRVRCVAQYRSN